MQSDAPGRMPLLSALEILHEARGDRIVITSMGATREWTRLPEHPLDFHFVPSRWAARRRWGWGSRWRSRGAR